MEIKPSLVYLLAFFSLTFLLHELSDWSHVLIAGGLCHCWPPRVFDSWTLCRNCGLDGRLLLLVLLPGPLITYAAVWWGYRLMDPDNPLETRSAGLSLFFAALPLTRIAEALTGKGDTTSCMRQLFQTYNLHHHRQVALASLALMLILMLPALIRAFLLLPGWIGKFLAFPALLLLPPWIDRLVVHRGMNALLEKGVLAHQVITGLHLIVLAWLLLLALVFLFTSGGLDFFLDYSEERLL